MPESPQISSDNFYSDLEAFSDFSTISELNLYAPVPSDWIVLAADIVRSGDAIANGRYKEVNFIGVSVISAVLNQVGREKTPFVFGGDGAVLLVPKSVVEGAKAALAGVKRLADVEAGLSLRIAAIPMEAIRQLGMDVSLRKYELSPGNYLAMAVGGGLDLADTILKDKTLCDPFLIEDATAVDPDLDGLSCRWEPLPSERGSILSLILKPTTAGAAGMSMIQKDIHRIVGFDPFGETESANHVTKKRLRFRFPPRGLGLEVRMLTRPGKRLSFAARALVECLAVVWGFATGMRVGPFRPGQYFQEICRHTDHRKMDDSLRLVFDVTADQLKGLKAYLEEAFKARQLTYGLHVSDSALMTCFMTDLDSSLHVHFIDGADGGLSVAASDFKARMASRD